MTGLNVPITGYKVESIGIESCPDLGSTRYTFEQIDRDSEFKFDILAVIPNRVMYKKTHNVPHLD